MGSFIAQKLQEDFDEIDVQKDHVDFIIKKKGRVLSWYEEQQAIEKIKSAGHRGSSTFL